MRLTTPRRLTIAVLATVGALFGATLVAAPAAAAPPYIVTNNTSAGQGSLPQEVADAIADGGGTITFDMTTVTTPITLTAGIPLITEDITIQGPGIGLLTVNTWNGGPGLIATGDTTLLTLNDISFDSAGVGILGVNCTEANLDLDSASISGYDDVGIFASDCHIDAVDSFISNNGAGGVIWQGTNDVDLEGIHFTDVTVNNDGPVGISVNSGSGAGDFDFTRVNAQLHDGWAVTMFGVSSFGTILFDGGEYQQNASGISIAAPDAETIGMQDIDVHDNEGQGINLAVNTTDVTLSDVHSDDNGTLSPVEGGGLRLDLNATVFNAYFSSFNGNTSTLSGGGVYIGVVQGESSVTFTNTDISDNTVDDEGATSNGGGVGVGTVVGNGDPDSFLNFVTCTITGNTVDGNGGGIYIDHLGNGVAYSGQLYIVDTTIDNNHATNGNGGGIAIAEFSNNTGEPYPFIQIDSSTISNNFATNGVGGGFWFDKQGANDGQGTTTLVGFENTTISENDADFGGAGLLDTGDGDEVIVVLEISLSTIVNSSSGLSIDPDVLFTLTNSIVSNNGSVDLGYVPPDPAYLIATYNNVRVPEGGVLAMLQAQPGNQIGIDPLLGPLAPNGGPTLTHLPLAGSPVFNAGDPAFVGPPNVDQRGDGFPRVLQGRVDMGSVESPGPLPATGGTFSPLLPLGALLFLLAGAALVVARRRTA